MKAITIRLTEIQIQQVEKFANEKRTTMTDALRFAALSFLENHGKQEKENKEHEQTREQLIKGFQVLAEGVEKFKTFNEQYLKAIYSQVAPKQSTPQNTNGGKQ